MNVPLARPVKGAGAGGGRTHRHLPRDVQYVLLKLTVPVCKYIFHRCLCLMCMYVCILDNQAEVR